VLARLPGPPYHDLADRVGNLGPAACYKLVVYPADQNYVAVPAVFKLLP
jgi:hypothetical protein